MKSNKYFLVIALSFVCLCVITIVSCSKDDPVVPDPPKPPSGSKPVVSFIANKTLSLEAEAIQFTDQSTNAPTSWSWDFGDGGSSTEKNPIHIYSTKGKYSVKLIATNQYGSGTLDKNNYLNVIREIEVGVSEAFVDLEFTNGTVDNYDLDGGTTTISFTGAVPDIVIGAVLTVDVDTMGYLRKVVSSQVNGNTVTIETEQAFLQDIFVDRDFNLSTEMIEPNRVLKSSSSNMEVSLALTDFDGYIHPAEIIYHQKDGSVLKYSALNFKSSNTKEGYKVIDFTHDFSKTDLSGEDGDDVHLYIDEGEVSLTTNALFEFDFDYTGELTADTRVKKGDIKSFKFSLENQAGFKAKLALDLKKEFSKEEEKELVKNLVKVTVKFLIGPVPFWISFDVDIFGKYSLEASASLNADWGFESNHSITVGGTYVKDDDSFTPVNEYNPSNIIYPLNVKGELSLAARFELYPKIGIKFYSVFGPYVDIVPNLDGAYKASAQIEVTSSGTESFLAWNSSLDLGLDLRVGTELSFLGLSKTFGPEVYECFKDPLWSAPTKLELTSALAEEAATGSTVPLTFKVTDLLSNSVPLCPVYIEGDGSFSKKISITDTNGEVSVDWVIDSTAKENKATVTIYNADKAIIEKVELSINGILIQELASVTTAEVSNITETTAESGGNVISDGNSTVIWKGVCWSKNQAPTVSDDSPTNDGTGKGEFISSLTGLSANTTYYVRAFARNDKGTSYGAQVEFTTSLAPTVTTTAVSEITSTTATAGGEVTNEGSTMLTARGVCWSTSESPTIYDDNTSDGTGIGGFISSLTNLTANTTYYMRAYATNSEVTGYGNQVEFTTNEEEIVFGTVNDSRDNRTYKTVEIGDQTWFAENLAYLPEDGDLGGGTSSFHSYYVYGYTGSDVSEAKATDNYETYGVLYSWIGAMGGSPSSNTNPSGVQGACPGGWHLPSDNEWVQLEVYLGMLPINGSYGRNPTDEGKKLKSTSGWLNGTDDYGFKGLPGGWQAGNSVFIGRIGAFRSSTEDEQYPYYAWSRFLDNDHDKIDRYTNNKTLGFSVRCVKD